MSLGRMTTVFVTAALTQGSRINITDVNKTFQVAYSIEGSEDLELNASCVTNAINNALVSLPEVKDEDANTTQLSCNMTAFFNNSIFSIQASPLSPYQCELLENMTWVMIYSTCMNQTDQNHPQSDNTQNSPRHYSAQGGQSDGNSEPDYKLIIGVSVGALTFFAIVLASVKAYAERDDLDSPAPTPRGPGHK